MTRAGYFVARWFPSWGEGVWRPVGRPLFGVVGIPEDFGSRGRADAEAASMRRANPDWVVAVVKLPLGHERSVEAFNLLPRPSSDASSAPQFFELVEAEPAGAALGGVTF